MVLGREDLLDPYPTQEKETTSAQKAAILQRLMESDSDFLLRDETIALYEETPEGDLHFGIPEIYGPFYRTRTVSGAYRVDSHYGGRWLIHAPNRQPHLDYLTTWDAEAQQYYPPGVPNGYRPDFLATALDIADSFHAPRLKLYDDSMRVFMQRSSDRTSPERTYCQTADPHDNREIETEEELLEMLILELSMLTGALHGIDAKKAIEAANLWHKTYEDNIEALYSMIEILVDDLIYVVDEHQGDYLEQKGTRAIATNLDHAVIGLPNRGKTPFTLTLRYLFYFMDRRVRGSYLPVAYANGDIYSGAVRIDEELLQSPEILERIDYWEWRTHFPRIPLATLNDPFAIYLMRQVSGRPLREVDLYRYLRQEFFSSVTLSDSCGFVPTDWNIRLQRHSLGMTAAEFYQVHKDQLTYLLRPGTSDSWLYRHYDPREAHRNRNRQGEGRNRFDSGLEFERLQSVASIADKDRIWYWRNPFWGMQRFSPPTFAKTLASMENPLADPILNWTMRDFVDLIEMGFLEKLADLQQTADSLIGHFVEAHPDIELRAYEMPSRIRGKMMRLRDALSKLPRNRQTGAPHSIKLGYHYNIPEGFDQYRRYLDSQPVARRDNRQVPRRYGNS